MPWTHGNFVDSLAAGYPAEVLRGPRAELLGYWVAMPGVDELHLLNITVVPAWRGRGLAVVMLDRLVNACRQRGLTQLWLEVRASNERARAVYLRYGFSEVGQRRAYYPVPQGPREDALLMIRVLLSGIPICGLLVALYIVSRYSLTERRMYEIRAELEARRGAV